MRQFLVACLLWLPSFAFSTDVVPGQWIVSPVDSRGYIRHSLVKSATRPRVPKGWRVQPNYLYRAGGADPAMENSWGLDNHGQTVEGTTGLAGKDIGAKDAWSFVSTYPEVVVAVLDSGVDPDHVELRHQLWKNPGEIAGNLKDDDQNGFVDDTWGWNFVAGNKDPSDDNGHGTFCAGIIGAEAENGEGTRGIYPGARIVSVKMLDKAGVGNTADAISAIEYAVKNGAKVINASWGGKNFDQALYDSVKWAGTQGVLFVAAAGNDGQSNDLDPKPIYPASFRLSTIVSVAAYDNRDAIAKFSNFGKETVHLGAPGVAIYSTAPGGGYRFGEGTSFAAPFVTGVAAFIKALIPGATLQEWRDRLLQTSEPIHYYEKERTGTAGRVHASNAARDIRPPRPRPPSQWVGRAASEGTAHPYANKESLQIKLEWIGATHIRAHLAGFDTESCCDKVVMKDKTGRAVAEYRGKLGDFWSADALGDTLLLEFTSDFSMTANGFDIDRVEAAFGGDETPDNPFRASE